MTVLDRILEAKRAEVDARRRAVSLDDLRARAADAPSPRSLRDALRVRGGPPRVVAEVKRASPSRGLIREDFDAPAIASAYQRGGAAGISVLTDTEFFGGSLADLEAVRRTVERPVLRKDFLIDAYQVWEARAAGADAVLLIVAALEDARLAELGALAGELGMDVLWEVHDAAEADRLAPLEPALVGINNRDLRTFEVRLETTRDLVPRLPRHAVSVSESGFFRREELDRMLGWGVDAFLIGESLMRAPDPGAALAAILAEDGGRRDPA